MPNLNRVFLMGHLTRDPEVKATKSGTSICTFGIATSRKYTTKDGKSTEETCFVDCVAWGKSGDILARYVNKGSPLFVEGRLTYQSWTTQDGAKRTRHVVTVDNFQFLGGPRGEKPQQESPPETPEPQEPEDDIPF